VLSSHTRQHKKWVLKAGGCLKKVNISTHLTFGNILFGCLKPRSHCPGVSPGASRQLVAGGPGRTGANRGESWEIRVRSYIPGSATDQTRFGAKRDHGLSRWCYGLRRYIPGVAPEALRCVLVRPDTPRLCPGQGRQRPGVNTASHGRRTVKPRCYWVAYEYQWNLSQIYYLQSTELNLHTKAKKNSD